MENNAKNNITYSISETKQDDESLDENIYFDAAEDTDTKMEDNTEIT